jgi:hypothetical protein
VRADSDADEHWRCSASRLLYVLFQELDSCGVCQLPERRQQPVDAIRRERKGAHALFHCGWLDHLRPQAVRARTPGTAWLPITTKSLVRT